MAQLISEGKAKLVVSQQERREQKKTEGNCDRGKRRSTRTGQDGTENESIGSDTHQPGCISVQNLKGGSCNKNYEENDNDDTGKTNGHENNPSSDRRQCIEKPNHRFLKSLKRHELVDESTNHQLSISSSKSSVPVALTNSRTIKRSNTIRQKNVAPTLSSTKLNSTKSNLQQFNARAPVVTRVGSVRSIVRLRPPHWNKDGRSQQKINTSGKKMKVNQGLAKASTLAAATRFSFRRRNETKKLAVGNFGRDIRNSSELPPSNKQNTALMPFDEAKSSHDVIEASFSFAPSFIPTKSTHLLDDFIGDESGDECQVFPKTTNNSSASTTSFKRRRQSKVTTGEWVRRLIVVHSARSNNSLRLQNKALSHKRILLDVTDPRKRAKTYTDVTILGQYNGPWFNVPENMKVTVLGYTHRHVRRLVHRITENQQRQEDTNTIFEAFFAWLTFTIATARRIELDKGCKLRIYDAVILPCRQSLALDVPLNTMSFIGKMETDRKNVILCEKTIICTDICEKLES